jgi:hypothetical protein
MRSSFCFFQVARILDDDHTVGVKLVVSDGIGDFPQTPFRPAVLRDFIVFRLVRGICYQRGMRVISTKGSYIAVNFGKIVFIE